MPEDHGFLLEVVRRNQGLNSHPLSRAERQEEPAVRCRWKRWLRFGGGYDWRLLRRRMAAEGLRPSAVYQPRQVEALPAWASILQGLRQRARALGGEPEAISSHLPPGAMALPFAELLAPCLLLGRELLAAHPHRGREQILADSALEGLELALIRRLGEVLGPSLLALFDTRRQTSPVLLALFSQVGEAPRVQYQAFVVEQLADAYRELGERWPVSLRLMAELVAQWAEACTEFLDRLVVDYPDLRATFFPGSPGPGQVTTVDATLSDPHAGGRTVLQLGFADGSRLVYKPRPMEMEVIFSSTLGWFNGQLEARFPLHRVPRVLARENHGWMEWVAAAPMAPGEAWEYHWRLGSLMALYRTLRGVDMHLENLVAAGCQPVFVDVECLLHPSSRPFLEKLAQFPGPPGPREFLSMGILPFYTGAGQDGRIVNLGGIGKIADERGVEMPVFHQVNGDWMRLDREPRLLSTHHQPRTLGGWVNSLDHAGPMAAGYRQTLELLLSRRDWLLHSPLSPWADLARARGRHLARSTWSYGLLMDGAVAPEALEDGVMFDLTFEALHRRLHELSPGYRAMAPAERRDLRRLDVPRFSFVADSLLLFDTYGLPLGVMHQQTPFRTMADGLLALTPEAVAQEAALLELLLSEHVHVPDGGLAVLAEDLRGRHRNTPGGAPLWLGLGYQGEGVCMHPLGPGLYQGTAGIALALAAAGRVLADGESTRLAVETLKQDLPGCRPQGWAGGYLPGPGYDQGMAGMLQALLHCGTLAGDQELLRSAGDLALAWIAEPVLERLGKPGTPLDLLNGTAGFLLVLVQLYRAHPEVAEFLWAARCCGDHLLRQARPEAGGLAWGQVGNYGLSGLAHGGSGFALALGALYRATGYGPYREGVFGALAHEASLFVPEWGNWRDMRSFVDGGIKLAQQGGCSWCHGAPGIALARAALLQLLADDLTPTEVQAWSQDLETALGTTRQFLAQGLALDDLCCGTAGAIDILLECGRLLERPELLEAARRGAEKCQAAWSATGESAGPRYWFTGRNLAGSDLSLFKGLSGQVYLQSRLAAPDIVPCVLLPL